MFGQEIGHGGWVVERSVLDEFRWKGGRLVMPHW